MGELLVLLIGLILILIAVGVYFAPSIVAKVRKQTNFNSIFVLNLFLGWSLVGWVVSLVWAVKKEEA
ncbi:multisubunit Na+/H+ antiporter MnhG subunit [Virgibacillus natechei]|uniref:Multisubunit Na+/H+ antiporter MnhG subunit n=1 Tax=Virgibacillus natechei TaxID=1216297 RepID=A0ABS4IMC8_9BACI|nr:superinfection immunity protein [Virgibacillus natechei]MBP1971139.1 multisubunit Na+/H+ antiporter MnhG subunit [Virgibacillus natechei]UZD12175.1 superinfection immunity protein [Virgibacillus natechei]